MSFMEPKEIQVYVVSRWGMAYLGKKFQEVQTGQVAGIAVI